MQTTREQTGVNINWTDQFKLREGWITFVALLVAFMTVVFSIEGGKWVPGLNILPTAAIIGFLIGFWLAKTRFVPALLAHSFMLSVGMVVVGVLAFPYADRFYDDWVQRLGSIVLRTVRWTQLAFSGKPKDDVLVGLIGLGFLCWIMGYASAWLVFRSHKAWWACTFLGIVLLTNLSYNPPGMVQTFAIFILACLFLIVRFNVFVNEERWRKLRLYFRPGMARWAVGVGGALAVAVVAFALLAPGGKNFDPLQTIIQRAAEPWQNIQTSFGVSTNGGKGDARYGRSAASYSGFDKSFTIGGPINLSNDPILRVRGYDPTYLQAAVMDEYDGAGWLSTYQDAPVKNDIVFPQLSLAAGQGLPTSPDKGRYENQLYITMLQSGVGQLFTGGDAVAADRSSLLSFHWEPIIIHSFVADIREKDFGTDAQGRPRRLLVDNAGNPIPPDILPLVRLLREAAGVKENATDFPRLEVEYRVDPGSDTLSPFVRIEGSDKWLNPTKNADNTYTFQSGEYNYLLPSQQALKDLNIQPGASSRVYASLRITITRTQAYAAGRSEVTPRIYRNSAGTYSFSATSDTIRPRGLNFTTTADKDKFEGSELGKQIKAEVEKLGKMSKNAKVSYELSNGRPVYLDYEGYQPNYDDLLAVSPQKAIGAGESYSTQSLRYRGDLLSLQEAGTSYPKWVMGRYLKLPPTLPTRIISKAKELTKGITNPYDKAKAIENYLRNNYTYNLQTPKNPDGTDPIDYFLFESKQGYCVHYSSAMALMLRAVGVPTRIATGLIGGEYDPATKEYVARGINSHAWPQAYFPGYGWVNFEPTVAYNTIERPADPSQVPPPPTPDASKNDGDLSAPEKADPTQEDKNRPQPGQTPETTPTTPVITEPPFEFPYWTLIPLGLIAAVIVVWQFNKWWVRRQMALPDTSPRVIYARMQALAQGAGLASRSTMTPFEYSAYLGEVLPGVARPIENMTYSYVRNRYRSEIQSRQEALKAKNVAASEAADAGNTALAVTTETEVKASNWVGQGTYWTEFKAIQGDWQDYVESIIEYRRQRTLRRLTPAFLRKKG